MKQLFLFLLIALAVNLSFSQHRNTVLQILPSEKNNKRKVSQRAAEIWP